MHAKVQYKYGKKNVKNVFYHINTYGSGMPLFHVPPEKDYERLLLLGRGTFLERVKSDTEFEFFCKKCHRSMESTCYLRKLKLSPSQPLAKGDELPYMAEGGICCLIADAEKILNEGVSGIKLNKDIIIYGHDGEKLKGLGICQLIFEGKHAILQQEIIPEEGNCCWKCGFKPLLCQECLKLEPSVSTGICPECKSELFQDSDTKQPAKAISGLYDIDAVQTINASHWNGDDFFGGAFEMATSRGVSVLRKIGFQKLYANPITAWLDECTPKQIEKIEELAKIKVG